MKQSSFRSKMALPFVGLCLVSVAAWSCSSSSDGNGSAGGEGGADSGSGSGGRGAGDGSGGSEDGAGVVTSDWRNVRVGGGGYVTGIIHHPSSPDVYVRTDMGGAYRWDASTSRWVQLLDFLGSNQADSYGVLSLALDPNDADRLYLMTGKNTDPAWAGRGALLRSSDRGKTWERLEFSGDVIGGASGIWVGGNEEGRGVGERLQVDPHLGSVLFMGTTKAGLWKSTNSGSTWSQVTGTGLSSTTNVNFVLFDPSTGASGSASQRILVGTTNLSGSALLLSEDGGATWKTLTGQPSGVMPLRAALAGSTLYLTYSANAGPNNSASSGGGVYKTTWTTGSSWTFTNVTPPSWSNAYGGVSVDPADANHVVVSSLYNWNSEDIFRSTNGGSSWTALKVEEHLGDRVDPHVKDSYIHWITDVQFNPRDTSELSFITGQGLYTCESVDTTPVCSFDNVGMEMLVPLQIVSPPSGAHLISVVGDRDGYRHDDLEISPPAFAPHKGTTRSLAFAEQKPTHLVKTFDQAPFGAYSPDAGTTWTDFPSSPANMVACEDYFCGHRTIAISADASRIVWSPISGVTSWSSDQGQTWTASTGITRQLGRVPARPVADRVNPDKFYALDVMTGTLFRSTDGGSSFQAGTTTLPHATADWFAGNFELSVAPGQEGHLWAAVADGNEYGMTGGQGLYRSTDSGVTFTRVATSAVTAAFRVGFGAAAPGASYPAVYLSGTVAGVAGIFRSTDEGATWVRQNDDHNQFGTIHGVTGDPRIFGRIYVAAEGRGIVYTTKK